jgi:hypothetical protein
MNHEIFLNQGILMRFDSMATPMGTNLKKLSDSTSDLDLVDPTMYRQLIGYLMYLVNTRPNIFFAISTLLATTLFYSWDDPRSDLNKLPTTPSKTIDPPGNPEGNTAHKVYCAVSHEIALWVTAMLRCLQSRKEWGYGIAIHLLKP